MNKKVGISFFILSFYLHLTSAELIKGTDDAAKGETFSFNVQKNILSSNGTFYEGAAHNINQDQTFALSRLTRGASSFTPLCPELVTLDSVPDSINPLFGAGIIGLTLLEVEDGFFIRDLPLVVSENQPSTVYLIENSTNPEKITIVGSGEINDVQGNVSAGIVDITTNVIGHAFAAAKPIDGQFGDLNSGIALLVRGHLNDKRRVFGQVNALTGATTPPLSLRLDPTSETLNIQSSELAHIVSNTVSLYWDIALLQLFIGLEVTANSASGDGAKAITICSFNETGGGIHLHSIAPDSAFAQDNTQSIVGVRGANKQVSIHAIKTMYTSTAINYLIVVGGNGNPTDTQQSVYALALVNTGEAKGTIAAKNAQPENIFQQTGIPHLIGRNLSLAATTPDQMPQATDVAAQVGGGKLTAGPIVNIITRDDTVFAFVGQGNPGVYSSQAIFDASGKIKAWTQWQRAAGTTDHIFGLALDAAPGNFILASGSTADEVKTIKRTIWSNGSPTGLQPLTEILDNTLLATNGGIQGLETFLPNTPGLNNIAVLAAGGIGTVLLAQTGTVDDNGIIIPTPGPEFNTKISFENGTINEDVDAKTVIISGGAVDNVGPITALEFAATQDTGWFFIGGSNGLAILSQEDGTGWSMPDGLGNNFRELTTGMSFKMIGDYNFVKKLVYDGNQKDNNFLYVITHEKIDRINLTTSNFATNTIDTTTIIANGTGNITNTGGFLDGIFSQACGIVATTAELLRIGDDKNVQTITDEADAQWTPIAIGENAGAPTALYTVTQTNRAQDITKDIGGYFYVLTANVGIDQARINRFAVQPLVVHQTMNKQTIQQFDDLFVKGIPSFLLSFGQFRSNFATDGALYFATRNKNIAIPPMLFLTPAFPAPRVGVKDIGDKSNSIKIDFQQGTEINGFERSQASGSWIIAGNFNTQVLE